MTLKSKLSLWGCMLAVLFPSCVHKAQKPDNQLQEERQSVVTASLPRQVPTEKFSQGMKAYLKAVEEDREDIHSIMILRQGKVVYEKWMGDGSPDKPHALWSVSKTFTSMAVGLSIGDGLLKLDDKLITFFPDLLPAKVSENLKQITVRDLLTMNCGHDTDPTGELLSGKGRDENWVKKFLAWPVTHRPGTYFCYNSLGTYMLSAIVQKVTGQKVVDYLSKRLFFPLGIDKPEWEESPQGINCGGWGLYLKTEDLAKMGLLLLQRGSWNGKQILPEEWVEEATKCQVPSVPAGMRPEDAAKNGLTEETSDWVQGYGYQTWQCRHHAFRADGMYGQYIIVIPKAEAVIVVTAHVDDMQKELNMIWNHILSVL